MRKHSLFESCRAKFVHVLLQRPILWTMSLTLGRPIPESEFKIHALIKFLNMIIKFIFSTQMFWIQTHLEV